MSHKLSLHSDRPLGDAWGVAHPDGYQIQLDEPLKKNLTAGALGHDSWALRIVINDIKLANWITSDSYRALWEYLRRLGASAKTAPKLSLRIVAMMDQHSVNMTIDTLTLSAIDSLEIKVREEINSISPAQ